MSFFHLVVFLLENMRDCQFNNCKTKQTAFELILYKGSSYSSLFTVDVTLLMIHDKGNNADCDD